MSQQQQTPAPQQVSSIDLKTEKVENMQLDPSITAQMPPLHTKNSMRFRIGHRTGGGWIQSVNTNSVKEIEKPKAVRAKKTTASKTEKKTTATQESNDGYDEAAPRYVSCSVLGDNKEWSAIIAGIVEQDMPPGLESKGRDIRDLKLKLLLSVFDDIPVLSSSPAKLVIIQRIEISCYNYAIAKCIADGIKTTWGNPDFVEAFSAQYNAVVYKIASNVKPENKTLQARLLKQTNLANIAKETSQELNPDFNAAVLRRIVDRHNAKVTMQYSTLHTCRKCKKNNCTIQSVQTRCMDESNDFIITCQNCAKQWRA